MTKAKTKTTRDNIVLRKRAVHKRVQLLDSHVFYAKYQRVMRANFRQM